jgi:hypothetical protein
MTVVGILRGVGSRLLECGCLVGVYETYDTRIIEIVDARKATCGNSSHRVGARLKRDTGKGPQENPAADRPQP